MVSPDRVLMPVMHIKMGVAVKILQWITRPPKYKKLTKLQLIRNKENTKLLQEKGRSKNKPAQFRLPLKDEPLEFEHVETQIACGKNRKKRKSDSQSTPLPKKIKIVPKKDSSSAATVFPFEVSIKDEPVECKYKASNDKVCETNSKKRKANTKLLSSSKRKFCSTSGDDATFSSEATISSPFEPILLVPGEGNLKALNFLKKKFGKHFEVCNILGKQVNQLVNDSNFELTLSEKQRNVWKSFGDVVTSFLGKYRAANYLELIENLRKELQSIPISKTLKMHMLLDHTNKFPVSNSDESEESGERFFQTFAPCQKRNRPTSALRTASDFNWRQGLESKICFEGPKIQNRSIFV